MAARSLIPALLLALAATAPVAGAEPPSSVVGVARDVVVDGPVQGDAIALLGNVRLRTGAEVGGHAVAIWGTVEVDPGARVAGRVISLSSLAALRVRASDGRSARASTVAVRVLVAGGWLLVTSLVALLAPVRLRYGAGLTSRLGLRLVLLGVLVALTVFAAMVAAIGLGPWLGAPLATALMLAFLLGKGYGLAVLGGALGGRLLQLGHRHHPPLTARVFLGVAVLLAVRVLPVVGEAAWTVVSVTALGAGVFALALAPDSTAVHAATQPPGSTRA